jgi:glycosyltransferase involved in cell wall biosynthesis
MKQKIVVLVRTRDEEHRIAKFCNAYKSADLVLVADGGSLDRTKKIAQTFDNVVVRDYPGRVQMNNGLWRNNDADHVNWLIKWSKEYDPDWVILDDCDMVPNRLMKREYRKIFAKTDCDYVMATKLYLWGKDQHFPYMAKPGAGHTEWEPSLWAWRGNQDFWMVDVPPAFTFRIGKLDVKDLHFDAKTLDIFPPCCLLHYSWDDPERVEKKVKFYRESGLIPTMAYPLQFAWPLEPLPSWAKD